MQRQPRLLHEVHLCVRGLVRGLRAHCTLALVRAHFGICASACGFWSARLSILSSIRPSVSCLHACVPACLACFMSMRRVGKDKPSRANPKGGRLGRGKGWDGCHKAMCSVCVAALCIQALLCHALPACLRARACVRACLVPSFRPAHACTHTRTRTRSCARSRTHRELDTVIGRLVQQQSQKLQPEELVCDFLIDKVRHEPRSAKADRLVVSLWIQVVMLNATFRHSLHAGRTIAVHRLHTGCTLTLNPLHTGYADRTLGVYITVQLAVPESTIHCTLQYNWLYTDSARTAH